MKIKRILSALVIGSMLITSSNLAYASAGSSDVSSSTGSSDVSKTPAVAQTTQESAAEAIATITEAENVVNSTVAGVGKSTVAGVYAAKSVSGTAVTSGAATVAQNLGLGAKEKAYVTTWDITAKKSPAAYASLQAGAASVGGKLGPMVQVNLNKMSGGKLVSLEGTGGKVQMAFGIPASFRGQGTYAMVHVVAGGNVEILNDLDSNPNTITTNVTAGNGAYAIIAY